METRCIDLGVEFDRGIAEGAALIRAGEVVAFPTETVYGLGANALNENAVAKIFAAKGRPNDNPLILHVSDPSEVDALAEVTGQAKLLMEAFWPGPLTIILKKRQIVPDAATAGLPTVAIRMPENPGALALIKASGVPIAAPSANTSGRPSPTTALHVMEDLSGKIPLILDGGPCKWGLESTVLSLVGAPVVLRPGAVTPGMLSAVIGEVNVAPSALSPLEKGEVAASPGMKYRHYAPRAKVFLASGGPDELPKTAAALYDGCKARGLSPVILASEQTSGFYAGRVYDIIGDRTAPETFCANLFSALRRADEAGYQSIILEALPADSFGLAYMNRALRAAGFRICTSPNEAHSFLEEQP
ncbi:MAG: L-threonylcarbamoyladenylate synthase [Christensenellales bacterium]|jgi:L-threonylcarbamoyladenylate synthase